MNRIIVVRHTFYGCCTYLDNTAGYLTVTILKTSIASVVIILSIIDTFRVAHSIIEHKLQLFCFDIVHYTYFENRWFKEKWALIHFHFARDSSNK